MRAGAPEPADAAMPRDRPARARWLGPQAPKCRHAGRLETYTAANPPKSRPAPRTPPRPPADCGHSYWNVELAILAKHQPGEKECQHSRENGHTLPGMGRAEGFGRLDACARENHPGNGRIAQAGFGAALVGYFDLDGMGAGIESGEGHSHFDLLRIDLL